MNARKHLAGGLLVAALGFGIVASASAQVVPKGLSETMGVPEGPDNPVPIELSVALVSGPAIGDGVEWTVFQRTNDEIGAIAAQGSGGVLATSLPPGNYAAHISFAGTSSVQPFAVTEAGGPTRFTLGVGGVNLVASSNGAALDTADAIDFTIYDTTGERKPIRRALPPGETIVLPAGVYRAVVRYGEHNALAGADVRVRAGEVTHATLAVSGAPVRLSLVREKGATAALAAVSWRIFDDGGKSIMDTDEPSPELVLAPGAYTAEVLHDGWTGVHPFEVVSGEKLELAFPIAE